MEELDPKSWLPLAQGLKLGQSTRTDHDCGPGRTLKLARNERGFNAWCWRCGCGGFSPTPEEPWQDRIARLASERAADAQVRATVELPTPKVTDPREWPLEARVWLYKAGFTNDQIVANGFYYHPPTHRVVLPLFKDGTVVYWQARGFRPDRPKYLNPAVDKPVAIFGVPTTLPLVLTEDLLSGIRCSDVAEAIPLLGTSLTDGHTTAILQKGRNVAIWLDPDGAGVKGAIKAKRKLDACGVNCFVVNSDKDPKYYTKEEIACHLNLPS